MGVFTHRCYYVFDWNHQTLRHYSSFIGEKVRSAAGCRQVREIKRNKLSHHDEEIWSKSLTALVYWQNSQGLSKMFLCLHFHDWKYVPNHLKLLPVLSFYLKILNKMLQLHLNGLIMINQSFIHSVWLWLKVLLRCLFFETILCLAMHWFEAGY